MARHSTILLAALLLVGCVARRDFVPPEPPAPLGAPPGAPAAAELPAPGSAPLTVRAAIRLALARNPDLAAARARIDAAAAGVDAARAAFWPTLSADLSYLRGDAPSAFLFKKIDARSLAPTTDFNDPGTFSNIEAGGTLRWNLWSGGRHLLATWAAEAAAGAAQAGRAAVENLLVAGVIAGCLDARAARAVLAADEASVRTLAAQVAETQVKVAGGSVLRSDLLSLSVRLAEARERRIRTETAERLALATLRRLLALPPDAPLALANDVYDAEPLPAGLGDAVAEAYRRRPDLKGARRAVEGARLGLESARRAWLPRLDLSARAYADDGDASLRLNDPDWSVALGLSFDVFDGGARRAEVRRARAGVAEVEAADRKVLLDVALEVETAWLKLEEARARVEVAGQAVGASEETFDLVEKQYRGGAATVTRYLEAEGERTRARTAKTLAGFDLARAEVSVARAIGRFAGTEGAAGEKAVAAPGGAR